MRQQLRRLLLYPPELRARDLPGGHENSSTLAPTLQRRANPRRLRLIPARIPGGLSRPPLEGARDLARDIRAGLLIAVQDPPEHDVGDSRLGRERPDRRGAANRLPHGGLYSHALTILPQHPDDWMPQCNDRRLVPFQLFGTNRRTGMVVTKSAIRRRGSRRKKLERRARDALAGDPGRGPGGFDGGCAP